MATKITEAVAVHATTKTVKKDVSYTVSELAQAARKIFGVSPDIVTAAFAVRNLKEATVNEARKIVTEFAKKEVM